MAYKAIALPAELLRRAVMVAGPTVVHLGHGPADALSMLFTWSIRKQSATERRSQSSPRSTPPGMAYSCHSARTPDTTSRLTTARAYGGFNAKQDTYTKVPSGFARVAAMRTTRIHGCCFATTKATSTLLPCTVSKAERAISFRLSVYRTSYK